MQQALQRVAHEQRFHWLAARMRRVRLAPAHGGADVVWTWPQAWPCAAAALGAGLRWSSASIHPCGQPAETGSVAWLTLCARK